MMVDSRPDRGALDGKRVVVVGGTSGMGIGAARAAAAAGADVVIGGRRPPAAREPAGEGSAHVVIDVADEASVVAAFDAIGALDHLLITAAPAPGSVGAAARSTISGTPPCS